MIPYRDESGGFHFWTGWPSWSRPSPYLSAYCMYALARARDAGYTVDSKTVTLGKSYLSNWLAYSDQGDDWPYSKSEYLTTRALAVYALSLWDTDFGVQPHLSVLLENLDQVSVFGKVYLLKALHRLGAGQGQEQTVIAAMNNKIKMAPTMVHYEEESEGGWVFHSNVRTTAAVLQALVETQGEVEFAEKAVKWLVSERKAGRWRTTQENIYVFDALAIYYREYEKVEPSFVATMQLEGERLLREVFQGRDLETRREFVGIDDLAQGVRQRIDISRRGNGRLYYGLRLSYAPKGELKPKCEGFTIERTIRPTEGRGKGFGRGQQYLVTLKMQTDQDRLYVVVDDPLPAGFEIVNTGFATESRESRCALHEARRSDESPRWWGRFDHEEIYDDRYVLFATALERGTHTKTYLVKAMIPGSFFMPPAKVEEMYTPEVFGRTGQQRIEVE